MMVLWVSILLYPLVSQDESLERLFLSVFPIFEMVFVSIHGFYQAFPFPLENPILSNQKNDDGFVSIV